MNQPNTYCFIFFYLLIVFTRTFLNFALASSNQVSTNWSISQLLAFQLSQNKIYCRVQEFTLLFSWKSIKTSKIYYQYHVRPESVYYFFIYSFLYSRNFLLNLEVCSSWKFSSLSKINLKFELKYEKYIEHGWQ